MIVCSDRHPGSLDPSPVPPGHLRAGPPACPALVNLARYLDLAVPPATWRLADPEPWGQWSTLCLVDEAPMSQFDALVVASRERAPLPEDAVCLALTGRHFHGNRRRPWQALRGNLHLSCFRRVRLHAARQGSVLPAIPTLAVVDLLHDWTGGRFTGGIKWVNDVLLHNHKIAGSLVHSEVRGDEVEMVTIGIGLNIAHPPRLPAAPLVPPPGALRQLLPGVGWDFAALTCGLVRHLDRRLRQLAEGGPDPILAAYRHHSLVLGRRVEVHPESALDGDQAQPVHRGVVRQILPDLSLLLDGGGEPVSQGRLRMPEAGMD